MLHIPDTAWKFGCGRYLQGADALEHLKEEIDRLGGKPFVIAGPHAWQAVLDAEPALSALQDGSFQHRRSATSACWWASAADASWI